jgi:hypothetical protein
MRKVRAGQTKRKAAVMVNLSSSEGLARRERERERDGNNNLVTPLSTCN